MLVLFRWGVFLVACAFLYVHLTGPKGSSLLGALADTPRQAGWWVLLGAVAALMPVNWGLESLKWRWLMRPVEPLRPLRAFLATMAGTSITFITPNRTGEFVGRVLFLSPENRVKGAFATALGSIAQFVVTLVAGALGLAALQLAGRSLPWPGGWTSSVLATLTVLVAAGSLVLYIQPGLLRQLLLMVPFLHRLERASAVLHGYQRHELLLVLGLSVLRYAVFAVQFVLALQLFSAGVPIGTALMAVPVIYLVSTLVPTVLLTELGVRGSAAVGFLVPLGGQAPQVLLATFLVWAVNLVLPAVAGSIILLLARIRTRST